MERNDKFHGILVKLCVLCLLDVVYSKFLEETLSVLAVFLQTLKLHFMKKKCFVLIKQI